MYFKYFYSTYKSKFCHLPGILLLRYTRPLLEVSGASVGLCPAPHPQNIQRYCLWSPLQLNHRNKNTNKFNFPTYCTPPAGAPWSLREESAPHLGNHWFRPTRRFFLALMILIHLKCLQLFSMTLVRCLWRGHHMDATWYLRGYGLCTTWAYIPSGNRSVVRCSALCCFLFLADSIPKKGA